MLAWLRRFMLSWVGTTVLLVVLAGAVLATVRVATRELETQSMTGYEHAARLLTDLTVDQNLVAAHFHGLPINDGVRARLDRDVEALVREGSLDGLEVWRSDGALVYADARHPDTEQQLPADELAAVNARGHSVVAVNDTGDGRGATALEVFLTYGAGADGDPDGIVEVILPYAPYAKSLQDALRGVYAAAALLLAATVLVVARLRRRVRLRDHQARHDPLTGLLNRTELHGRIDQALRTSAPGELMLVDLDGFKQVNEALGYPAGDVLLQQVSDCLRRAAPPSSAVARLGGDEFAILQPAGSGRAILWALRQTVFVVEGIEMAVEGTGGLVVLPHDAGEAVAALRRADAAMYRAKRAGTVLERYDARYDDGDIGHLGLLAELRRALARDELALVYQPKIDLLHGAVSGVEALVRWHHPERGVLGPGAFLPWAEPTNLMGPLTEWVIHRARTDAHAWLEQGVDLPVAINISPRTLLDQGAGGPISLLVHPTSSLATLEVEVTETAVMNDPVRAAAVLANLRGRGLSIAIDDFGTGYTSLALLRSLPVDVLKIDRTFVTELLDDPSSRAIVASTIDLAHRLGLHTVAEGVEDDATLTELTALGCDQAQGFGIALPMPADELLRWCVARGQRSARTGPSRRDRVSTASTHRGRPSPAA